MKESSKVFPKHVAPTPIGLQDRRWPSRIITQSPIWSSVDLRDGNQALPNPLNPEEKLKYFNLLCEIGFKEIEVSFPSASQDDYDFTRYLIENDCMPADVDIMVLTQCRPELIRRTFESIRGLKRGIFHAYCAASDLHMDQVFGLSREETKAMVKDAILQIKAEAAVMPGCDLRLEFSPEEFTDTDLGYALDLCEMVFETWGAATPEKPLILNLPATVERRPPNQYADMIEWFCRKFSTRDSVIISLHAHNDQGMAVAATELALLAGADRVEGTLFGHGERTGNVDLVTLANNLAARGIDTGLDFSRLPEIAATVEELTGMPIYYRQPYAGEYVFTAFSGSHQDAINKGMHKLNEAPAKFGRGWKVPYLHVDPADLGRKFERLIRINSQSGKGGIDWVMERDFGIKIPRAMLPEVSAAVQRFSDRVGREIESDEVHRLFRDEFVEATGPYCLVGFWPHPDKNNPTRIRGELKIAVDGVEKTVIAEGNGPISALTNAVKRLGISGFQVEDFFEQAIGSGADARALAFVPLKTDSGQVFFGVGEDTNIDQAAVRAVISGINRLTQAAVGQLKVG